MRYLNDARTIGDWIISNLTDKTATGYGGYYLGYPDQGVPPPKPLQTGKSVENNADIFAAFQALASAENQLGNGAEGAIWTSAANVAGDFVMQMFDATNGRFNAGTVPAGTTNGPGICSSGPQKGIDVINTCDFLDSNTFTTLALAGAPRYKDQIDWRRPVQFVLNNFGQMVNTAGQVFLGFDLVPLPVSGSNGIAWEFTGQAIEAMRYVDQLYHDTRFESSADEYLAQVAQAQTVAPFADGQGLVASTLQAGDTLLPLDQCLNTPFQCIAERVGLAATTWAILAERQINVLTTSSRVLDLVWQDPVTGTSELWFMGGTQGATVSGAAGLSGPNAWRIVGAAGFNGDGHPDLIWQDPVTGASQLWLMSGAQGATVNGAAGLSGPNAWRIAN